MTFLRQNQDTHDTIHFYLEHDFRFDFKLIKALYHNVFVILLSIVRIKLEQSIIIFQLVTFLKLSVTFC